MKIQNGFRAFAFTFVMSCGFSNLALAFVEGTYGVGVGYYSQNIMNRVSKSETGATSFLGETLYPLNLKYDYGLGMSGWFLSPQLSYSLMSRSAPEDTAKISLMHLAFLFGKNIGDSGSGWDWYFGPGIIQYDIKGAGGIVNMNNGTGTANFARPGGSSSVRKLSTNLGTSWAYGRNRLGLDLVIENLMSTTGKRSQSLMIGYSYLLGRGLY